MDYFFTLGLILFCYMSAWFVLSLVKKRNDVADTAWGLGFVLLAWTSFYLGHAQDTRGLLVGFLVSIWGIRLAWHIHSRNKGKTEDYRYAKWREEWGTWFYVRSYVQVYLLQGFLLFLIVLPTLFINKSIAPSLGIFDFVGVAFWIFGFIFESVGDAQLARFIKETADKYSPKFSVQMIYRRDRYGRGGDHIPFLERGFTAVRFTEPHEDYTHQHQSVKMVDGAQYGDLPEFVDFSYVANVARINAAALASLALAPAKPKNVAISTGRLTNDTDLKWDVNADADLAGYEIVWRDTTSPVWTNSLNVGNVISYTMKEMSKDNYFFGVRAVDKDGNKSPVVYPKPTR